LRNSASIEFVPEVRLLGGLRALLGAKSVSAKALVAGELLHEIAERGGEAAASLIFDADGGTPNQDLRILVNGRSVVFLDGLDTKLRREDTVTVYIAGARGFPGG
jgi:molybdopterin converting factor small subunit